MANNGLSRTHSDFTNKYVLEHYRTFSGVDIEAYLILPVGLKKIADLSTFSYSVYRDKQAVTPIGYTYPKGFTRGPRVIAGTMIFTVFDRSPFGEIIGIPSNNQKEPYPILVDQLPPIDMYLFMSNEHGNSAHLTVLGMELMNEGQIQSIDDLFPENTINYIARYIKPLTPTNKPLPDLKPNDLAQLHHQLSNQDIEQAKIYLQEHRKRYW